MNCTLAPKPLMKCGKNGIKNNYQYFIMSEIKPTKEIQKLENSMNCDESSTEEYNRDIETAMNEIDNGEYILHEEVVKMLLKDASVEK